MANPIRRVMNPLNRTAVLAFAWEHRHTILRWGRSLWLELRNPATIAPARLAMIGRVLWVVTSDEEVASSSQLRQVRLEGDTVVLDVAPNWERTGKLIERLLEVQGVRQVTTERALR